MGFRHWRLHACPRKHSRKRLGCKYAPREDRGASKESNHLPLLLLRQGSRLPRECAQVSLRLGECLAIDAIFVVVLPNLVKVAERCLDRTEVVITVYSRPFSWQNSARSFETAGCLYCG